MAYVARRGNPGKFNDEVKRVIIKMIATGNTRKTACACADISYGTLQSWITRANQGDGQDYVDFLEQLKKAEGKAVAIAVRNIRAAGRKNWTAFAWWLERKHPEDWSTDKEILQELKKIARESIKARRQKKLADSNDGTDDAKAV